eukprot:jgi/Botrbrau1/4703/Bobra.0218s0024.1
MLTGYSASSKAYRIYVGGGIWKESRDVVFVEHLRGASRVGMSASPTQPTEFLCPESSASDTPPVFPGTSPDTTNISLETDLDDPHSEPEYLPASSNLPTQPVTGPPREAEPESKSRRLCDPVEMDQTLEAVQDLARGVRGDSHLRPQMERAQEVFRPTRSECRNHQLDGLTRAQRHEQRIAAKDLLLPQEKGESREREGLTEGDSLSQGPGEVQLEGDSHEGHELHVSAVRGAATCKAANGPGELSSMGGSCSVMREM